MSVTMRFGSSRQVGDSVAGYDARPNSGSASLETRIRAAVRRCIAEEIERCLDETEGLMMVLDGLDVDADYEAEPDDEDGGDAEPSLGWPNPYGDQSALGNLIVTQVMRGPLGDDRELDEAEGRLEDAGDEREPDEDAEESLGWTVGRTTIGAFEVEARFRQFVRYRDEFDFEGVPADERSD